MVSGTFTILNRLGLHMRPARIFAQAMSRYESTVTIFYDGKELDGKSILQIMTGCIQCGAEIQLQCSGPDELEALQTAKDLILSGLEDEITPEKG